MKKSMFISFEGGEGCGKSTHIKSLCEFLKQRGIDCVVVREPGGNTISERIREILLDGKKSANMCSKTELLLFAAARAQLVNEVINPALCAGKCVISDRFYDSTMAYQGAARKLDISEVKYINDFAVSGTMPQLTLLLDIPVQEGLRRASIRDNDQADRMGSQNILFYNDVRNAFLQAAKENPKRFAVIDVSGSKDETFAKITKAVIEKFAL